MGVVLICLNKLSDNPSVIIFSKALNQCYPSRHFGALTISMIFCVFKFSGGLESLQTSLLCIVGELAGGGEGQFNHSRGIKRLRRSQNYLIPLTLVKSLRSYIICS